MLNIAQRFDSVADYHLFNSLKNSTAMKQRRMEKRIARRLKKSLARLEQSERSFNTLFSN